MTRYFGRIRETEGAAIMAQIVFRGLLIKQAQVEHIVVELHRVGRPRRQPDYVFTPDYQDVIFDVPQTSDDDPQWPRPDGGYNFRFDIPPDYLTRPETYRAEVFFDLTDGKVREAFFIEVQGVYGA